MLQKGTFVHWYIGSYEDKTQYIAIQFWVNNRIGLVRGFHPRPLNTQESSFLKKFYRAICISIRVEFCLSMEHIEYRISFRNCKSLFRYKKIKKKKKSRKIFFSFQFFPSPKFLVTACSIIGRKFHRVTGYLYKMFSKWRLSWTWN